MLQKKKEKKNNVSLEFYLIFKLTGYGLNIQYNGLHWLIRTQILDFLCKKSDHIAIKVKIHIFFQKHLL